VGYVKSGVVPSPKTESVKRCEVNGLPEEEIPDNLIRREEVVITHKR
jgi:hypothetical protein